MEFGFGFGIDKGANTKAIGWQKVKRELKEKKTLKGGRLNNVWEITKQQAAILESSTPSFLSFFLSLVISNLFKVSTFLSHIHFNFTFPSTPILNFNFLGLFTFPSFEFTSIVI